MSITALLGAIVPIFLFVGIGVALRRFGVLHRDEGRTLNSVIVYVALPALIFTSVAKAPLSLELVRAAGVAWAVSLAALSVAWEVAHVLRLPPRTAGAFVLVAALGNTGYLGYPIVRALLGQGAVPAAVFYDIFGTVAVLLTLGVAIASRYGEHDGRVNVFKDLLTFPAMIALFVALAFRFLPLSVSVSTAVMNWMDVAASMTVPLIMLYLGVSIEFGEVRGNWVPLSAVAGLKLLMVPALAVAVAGLLKDFSGMRLLALEASMPSVMLSLVVGHRFKLDTGFMASAILVTTIGCMVTIPLVQLLLP